jgi:CRP/FNR family transcriptional regulator, cyclic AMP receptor protein
MAEVISAKHCVIIFTVPAKARSKKSAKTLKAIRPFDLETHLAAGGQTRHKEQIPKNGVAFSQGSMATDVFYVQRGTVKISVISATGKEAVVGMLQAGDFFGEGCLSGQLVRMATATALVPSTVYRIPKTDMIRLLHDQQDFSDNFIRHVLTRSIRVEEDLVDQLFNSSEKRLARTLLLLAQYGMEESPVGLLPRLSQETLAEMIGSTRSRVNFFMNKFRKLGFIEYKGRVKVNRSLLSIVLHD